MQVKEKPLICVSKCLGFESCRYNGGIVNDNTIEKLKDYVTFITVCPECEIGLPVPRESLKIIEKGDTKILLQSKTNVDYANKMLQFSQEFSSNLSEIDAFILKSRSPSCGVKDVKIYNSEGKGASSTKGKGIFADVISKEFDGTPIEDEGRLSNYKIRESFFTKIFILSEFRALKKRKSLEELLHFHSRHKMLLNSYNIKETKEIGRLIANHDNKSIDQLLGNYELHLRNTLIRSPRYTSNINILQHSFGYFSKDITKSEKQFIMDSIEKYRDGKFPLSTPLNIIKAYIIRFDIGYLKDQSFFDPFPDGLIEVRDSGKGL